VGGKRKERTARKQVLWGEKIKKSTILSWFTRTGVGKVQVKDLKDTGQNGRDDK